MPLPASGQISFNDIRIELNVPSQTLFNLDSASLETYATLNKCLSYPNSTNPDAINEWYNYCHSCTGSLAITDGDASATSCNDACTSSPFIPCLFPDIYQSSSLYYYYPTCDLGPLTTYYAVYSGPGCSGTKLGQNCYTFSNGSLVSTEQCTTSTTTTTTTTEALCECIDGTCTSSCPNAFAGCNSAQDCFI